MNLPNRITMARIFLSILIIAILLFPFDAVGITTLKLFINESIVVDVKYLIVGGLFIVASITDFVDGYSQKIQYGYRFRKDARRYC